MVERSSRRRFLRRSLAAGLTFGLPGLLRGARSASGAGPNSEVGLGIVGLGATDAVGGVGGRGQQLIARFRKVPGVRITAIADVDQAILNKFAQQLAEEGEKVAVHGDMRKLFDDQTVDAVAIATPNHWHALASIWACQAGKDVYVEKPFSHSIWEGRQMVAAAAKYSRMMQVGTQRRSSKALRDAFKYVADGEIGAIRCAHALVYRGREDIGQVDGPIAVPETVDYDLWCGPAPKSPLMRKQLHYEWHWFWDNGNGEIGNNGAHMIDVGRWGLGQDGPPKRAISIGGRLGFDDCGQTPNTQVAFFDYEPAPLICEIRNYRSTPGGDSLGKFRGTARGIVVVCEGGYVVGGASGGAEAFDNDDRSMREFAEEGKPRDVEIVHAANFIDAVRSRKADKLNAGPLVGHRSAMPTHMGNISHRLGRQLTPEAIRQAIDEQPELADAFERCREYLAENGIDLAVSKATLGPWLTLDPDDDRFVGPFAEQANGYRRRSDRRPFVVPEIA